MQDKLLRFGPSVFFLALSAAFAWKFFVKGLVPIPADILVGIYYPWRDHIWNGLSAGVPFKNGLLSDVVAIIYPWRIAGIDLLKAGAWPLWLPQALCGSPLLANFQSAVFYPLNLLFWFFKDPVAWSLYLILQPLLAGIFTYYFLRDLKLTSLASLFGGLIFGFCGFALVWFEYGILGHAGLWLPLVLWALNRLRRRLALGPWLAGIAGVGLSALAGYPQITFYLLAVAGIFTVFLLRGNQSRRPFLTAALSLFVLGLLLAAPQLVPGGELWYHSIRQADPTVAALNFGLMPPQNLITFVAPDFFGHPATQNFWGSVPYNDLAGYVGLIPLFFALTALLSKTKKPLLSFFGLVLAVSLLLVLDTPLARGIYHLNLPGLQAAAAGRILFAVDFSLAVLAAYGLEFWLTDKKKHAFPALKSGILLTLIFAGLWLIAFGADRLWPGAAWLGHLPVARRNLIQPTVIFGGLVGVEALGVILHKCIRRHWFSSLISNYSLLITSSALVGLTIFDLFRFGWKYNPFVSPEYLYPATDLTSFLQEKAGTARFVGLIPQSMWLPYGFYSPEGYEPLQIRHYSLLANQINEPVYRQASTGSRWVTANRPDSPLLDLMGVRYLLVHHPVPASAWDPQYYRYSQADNTLVFQKGLSQVYERTHALPRTFVAFDYEVLPDEQALKKLTSPDFDLGQKVVLSSPPGTSEPVGSQPATGSATLHRADYNGSRVVVTTTATAPGLLVLTDTFYPGWQAYVDGLRTPVFRADVAFRAVSLPAGKHSVEFQYDPKSFKIGWGLNLAAAGLVGLVVCRSILKKK